MKGVIFNLLETYVIERYGDAVLEEVLASAELETDEPFVGPGTYPATDLLALVVTTADATGESSEDIVRGFGRFAFPFLARSVSGLMSRFADARTFLEQLEPLVHSEVRKLDPEARPARFSVEATATDTLLLRYESPLHLYPLVHGLLDGTADWFGTPFRHELDRTDGDIATFRLDFSPATPVGAPAGAGASTDHA